MLYSHRSLRRNIPKVVRPLRRRHGDAALRVAQLLSNIYHTAYQEVRSLGLLHSSVKKLTKFPSDWSDRHGQKQGEIHLKLTLTHEEIAGMIGASRETVTRFLADFKKKQLVQIKGSTLLVRGRAALESLAGSQVPFPVSGLPKDRLKRVTGL